MILAFVNLSNAQNDDRPEFNMSMSIKYLSRFVAYGIDLAGDSPAWGGSMSIGHRSGVYADTYYTRPTSTAENAQQWNFDVGYEQDIFSRVNFYAEFAHYIFATDTVNIFAEYSNSLSLNLVIDLDLFEVGLSYDRFLGAGGATYFGADISTFIETGPVYLLPMIQFVFISQTVDDRYLSKGKSKKDNSTYVTESTEIKGLANTLLTAVVIYPVTSGLSFSLIPTLILSHKSELSVESTRFVWNASLRYSFDF
jgi:hypothetical protein